MNGDSKKHRDLGIAKEFLSFNNKCKSPYHAAEMIANMLRKHDFKVISEMDDWCNSLKENGRYMFTRDGSSIIAFAIGNELSTGDQKVAFSIIGAHTDSPCFKVKPVSKISAHGYLQLGVECYGGGLWHTWFDRDLTVAGRVIVKSENGAGPPTVRLVSIPRPILRIPNLAIHLSRNVTVEGFKVNKESDTVPILATQLAAAINSAEAIPSENKDVKGESLLRRHPPLLISALARELQVEPEHIIDVDLYVSDTQPAAIGGVLQEFVFAPRLDNLASCFTAVRSLTGALNFNPDSNSKMIRMIACFDHEEVGSRSSRGADSPMLTDTMRRICNALSLNYNQVLAESLLVSADMAHAIHPNYSSKHEANHRPKLGGGLVVKTNQNQRYATSGISGYIIREAARRAGNMPLQEFVVPNDKPCGSTIGPLLSSRSGLRTVDVGAPMLSMHSVREMCGVDDFYFAEQVLREVMLSQQAIIGELEGLEITD